MLRSWSVMLEPVGSNPNGGDTNTSGLSILLVTEDRSHEHELARVAFVRRNSANPNITFVKQLEKELAKADAAADALNDALDDLERQKAEEFEKAREKIREILGDPDLALA